MSLRSLRERLITGAMTPMTRDPKHGVIGKAYTNQCDDPNDPNDPNDPTKPRVMSVSDLDSSFAEALARAAHDLPLTSRDLYETLAPEDIAAWRASEIGPEHLRAFAMALDDSREREAGRVPDSYEDIAICRHCGPVWLFMPGDVPSCPWCLNRMANRPIPRPNPVTCGTCRHFRFTDHAHLGRCAAGVRPAGASGHWDTDRHGCGRWLPNQSPNGDQA